MSEQQNDQSNSQPPQPPKEKKGTNQIKAVLELAIKLGQAVEASMLDKKIQLDDLQHFFGVVGSIAPAIENFEGFKEEMSDLDQEEAQELVQWLQKNFNLADDQLEHVIEHGISLVAQLFVFVKGFKK